VTRRHWSCPTCVCNHQVATEIVINVNAPFFPLVVEADRIAWEQWIARRTASRRANAELVAS
jgi:hypothetical protein